MGSGIFSSSLICALYSLACLCFGALLLRVVAPGKLTDNRISPMAVGGTAFLLGQGILAAIWLLLALFSLFSPPVIIAILIIVTLGGVLFALPILERLSRGLWSVLTWSWQATLVWKAIVLFSVVLLAMIGACSFLPPTGRGDALAFYMALPKVIASTYRLQPLPGYEDFMQIGLQGELHLAALMSLNLGTAAKVFMWPTSLAAAAMLLAIGKQIGLRVQGQWIALVALFTSTAFTNSIWDGKVDLFSAAMGLAAFYWGFKTNSSFDAGAIRLAGLFTGLAIVAKISYLIVLPAGILLLVLLRNRATLKNSFTKNNGSTRNLIFPMIFLLGFWAALPLIPNVIKNTLLFDAPFAPLFSPSGTSIIGQSWFSRGTALRINLLYPLSLVFGQFWAQGGHLSPLFLAFTPLCMLLPRTKPFHKSKLVEIALAGSIGIVVWVIYRPTVFAPRYILASLLILLLVSACGAEHVLIKKNTWPSWLKASIIFAILATLLLGIGRISGEAKIALQLAIGQKAECDFERINSDASCRIASVINAGGDKRERVYLATYYRYWLMPSTIQCLSTEQEAKVLASFETMDDRWSYFYERGFRYLVVDTLTHAKIFDTLDVDQTPDWLEVERIFDADTFIAFRFTSKDPAHYPLTKCAQIDPPLWEVVTVAKP